jgi:hypothetical protein
VLCYNKNVNLNRTVPYLKAFQCGGVKKHINTSCSVSIIKWTENIIMTSAKIRMFKSFMCIQERLTNHKIQSFHIQMFQIFYFLRPWNVFFTSLLTSYDGYLLSFFCLLIFYFNFLAKNFHVVSTISISMNT